MHRPGVRRGGAHRGPSSTPSTMKWLRTLVVFDKGGIVREPNWAEIHKAYLRGIAGVTHPAGAATLTLRKKVKIGEEWRRNGVRPLRDMFLQNMKAEGWEAEEGVDAVSREPVEISRFPEGGPYREDVK